MAVYRPCAGVAPEAMANAMASGMATMPTTTPATRLGIRCARFSRPARCASRRAIMARRLCRQNASDAVVPAYVCAPYGIRARYSASHEHTPEFQLRVTPSPVNPWLALAGWIALCAVAGAIGAIASVDAAEFYATLERPSWAPPAGVFGPVWTLLYMSMAVAAWLVWRERGWARARGALGLFVAAARFQRAVVVAVLRLASRRAGVRRHPRAAGAHRRDHRGVRAHSQAGGMVVGAVSRLGELRDAAQLFRVAAKSSAAVAASHVTCTVCSAPSSTRSTVLRPRSAPRRRPRTAAARTRIGLPVDDDLVRRAAMAVVDREARPVRRHAGREREPVLAQAESEDPFETGAIQPAGRTRVPGPAAAPGMRRLGVHVRGDHVGLDLVALHVGARASRGGPGSAWRTLPSRARPCPAWRTRSRSTSRHACTARRFRECRVDRPSRSPAPAPISRTAA